MQQQKYKLQLQTYNLGLVTLKWNRSLLCCEVEVKGVFGSFGNKPTRAYRELFQILNERMIVLPSDFIYDKSARRGILLISKQQVFIKSGISVKVIKRGIYFN